MVTLPGDCHSTAKRCFAMTEYFVRKGKILFLTNNGVIDVRSFSIPCNALYVIASVAWQSPGRDTFLNSAHRKTLASLRGFCVFYSVVFSSFAVCSFADCSSDGGFCSFFGVFCSVSVGASVFFLRPISFSSFGKSGV